MNTTPAANAIDLLTEPNALGHWPHGFWHLGTRYTVDSTGYTSFRDDRATLTVHGPRGRQRLTIRRGDPVLLVSRMSWASPGVELAA